ncbi:hypothetical protein [Microvirga roseola]|uniref:hypothetical protein n=1 Tax=Microvirga roseola TaxID=2883126 RepID=UPI001E595E9C|nr:hypothetical protein [Microvirga roseola]
MVAFPQPNTSTGSYETWKAEAISYAWRSYCLPEDCIEDGMYRPLYNAGATPQAAVDDHCEDCGINKLGPWNTI